ncbi:MAG: cobalamin B12-binding domain-containing protein [bacterium]
MRSQRILGACLGECIHVAGIMNFLRLAESLGYQTEFMGSATPVEKFVSALCERKPDLAAISYRLTPQVAEKLFDELKRELARRQISGIRFVFGGTPPVTEIARSTGLFEAVFSGQESSDAVVDYLKRESRAPSAKEFAQTLVERIRQNQPFPLLRHHLGLETVEKTVENARKVALSGELDILSIAPDQNAQEYFFRPAEMLREGHGAGGVPVRTPEDMRAIYEASRCGNFPLVRCYGGTRDLLRWAEMSVETINIAWGAIPLFWYSELDKRSNRPLVEAIRENQATIRWYAERGIPVEVNDSHQWSLRDAHDSVAVAAAFLAAYNAKALGVRHYVSQYMLNTPPETSPAMDLAKMLAKIEMIEGLHDEHFASYRQIRTGLRSMVPDPDIAKGHLMASITLGMFLQPHIVHVVGYCEADHAATATEIIESCRMARGAIRLALGGLPDITRDPAIRKRKRQLIEEANLILQAILDLGEAEDPLTDPNVLARAVRMGILDAPHLRGSGVAPGDVVTMPVDGCYVAIEPSSGRALSERKRLARITQGGKRME